GLWKGRDIVKAIGRGFNPKYAINLAKDDYGLLVISLDEMFHGNENDIKRVKARVIGEGGKARRIMETLSNTKISVYGKTVSVIGGEEDVGVVEDALKMLISGARHATVYRFMEGMQKEKRLGL
ncbi:MAG: RNA-processing protein, partial [Candidatus Altiarchaeota archaeon]|nr:RNA-processing protein [Candidatus Altiarchaeota archaeon]